MKNAIIAAILSLTASAGIASAQNAGHAQLAQQLHLDGAEFTTAELVTIADARRENDTDMVKYYLKHENRTVASAGEVTPGKAQLAAQLGVNPADYTLSELVTVQSDLRQNDAEHAAFVLSGAARQPVAPHPVPYRGHGRDE